jgi:hypothetical protein
MPLVLKVMLLDTDSGARGETATDLRTDAVTLSRQTFLTTYCAPAIAAAWEAMAEDRAKRAFASEQAANIIANDTAL